MRTERFLLFVIVFLCGGAVLVVELISARQLSPFYGSSLTVWTAIISVTLAALSMGYAVGGWLGDRLSVKRRGMTGLAVILTAAAVGCGLLPAIGPHIMRCAQGAGLIGGALLSAALMLLPALAALGMVGPFVIRLLTQHVDQAGRVAGRVFAVSTVGSILAALATGFYLAPFLGVRGAYLLVAIVLGGLALGTFLLSRQSKLLTGIAAVVIGLTVTQAALSLRRPVPAYVGSYTILYISQDSSYGEVKVLEPTPRRRPSDSTP